MPVTRRDGSFDEPESAADVDFSTPASISGKGQGPGEARRTPVNTPSQAPKTKVKHPVRPRATKLNVAEAHKAIASQFPKILAELAK